MKHITTIFFLLLLALPATAQQWESFTPPGGGGYVRKLRNLQNNVFVVRPDGVYRSADGGNHWQKVYDYQSNDIPLMLEVNHFNNRLYYAQAPDTTGWKLYTSANLGDSWTYIGRTALGPLDFIEDTLYTSYPIQNVRTLCSKLNSGPWKPIAAFPKDTAGDIYDIATHGKHLWVLTAKGIYHSEDAGYHWEHNLPLNNLSNQGGANIKTANNEVVMTDEYTRRLYYSNDHGIQWEEIPWYGEKLQRSGQHLYVTDTTGTQISRFEGGSASNWSKDPLETQVDFQLDGVGEHEGSQWLGSNYFGVLRKKPDATEWKTVNNNLSEYPGELRYSDDCIFIANNVQTFSLDDGQTWEQKLKRSTVESVWRNGDFDYALSADNFRDIYRCPHNQRYEWEVFSTLPGQGTTVAAMGDTVLVLNTNENLFYQSFDKGANWITFPAPNGDAPVQVSKGNFFQSNAKTIYRSADGGTSWQGIYTFPFSQNLSKFYIIHDTFLVAYLPEDRIFYSIDDGQTFDTLNAPQNPNTAIYRMRTSNGLLILNTGDELLHVSKDVGKTWTTSILPQPIAGFGENSLIYGEPYLYFYGIWRIRLDQERTATGKVFLDLNGNGIYEFYEKGLNGMIVQNAQGNMLAVTYDEGDFRMALGQEADILSVANVPPYYTVSPASIPVSAGVTNIPSMYFALKPLGTVHDASVNLIAASAFRGGYDNTLYINAKNAGTLPSSGQLKLVSDPLLSVISITPAPDIILGDTLVWNYTNLSLLGEYKVQIEVSTAVVPPGTPIVLRAHVLANLDVDATNDVAILDALTIASFDPNDKAVSETQVPATEADSEELVYTVRFQNLGNIETDFITLRDTLSESLDVTSIRVLAASHPYEWSIEDGRVLVFRFNPIRLAPAILDTLGSQGFIQFTARLKPGLQVGDEIANTAHIYFDFNPTVVTNTVVTEITVVSVFEPPHRMQVLKIFPNPSADHTTIRLPEEIGSIGRVEIFSVGGRLLYATVAPGNSVEIDLSGIPTGAYWCRWFDNGKVYWGKLVVAR